MGIMIVLYDNVGSLPKDLGEHILVFTGKSKKKIDTVTEVTCQYRAGNQLVIFKRNADTSSQRFEEALVWAAERANVYGIKTVHAVFELNRPIDERFLRKVFAEGIVDRRMGKNAPSTRVATTQYPLSTLGKFGENSQSTRRRLVFRRRDDAIKLGRSIVRTH